MTLDTSSPPAPRTIAVFRALQLGDMLCPRCTCAASLTDAFAAPICRSNVRVSAAAFCSVRASRASSARRVWIAAFAASCRA
ncbi:hypothetical protein CA831_38190, partial [Burkholderia multivorans]